MCDFNPQQTFETLKGVKRQFSQIQIDKHKNQIMTSGCDKAFLLSCVGGHDVWQMQPQFWCLVLSPLGIPNGMMHLELLSFGCHFHHALSLAEILHNHIVSIPVMFFNVISWHKRSVMVSSWCDDSARRRPPHPTTGGNGVVRNKMNRSK